MNTLRVEHVKQLRDKYEALISQARKLNEEAFEIQRELRRAFGTEVINSGILQKYEFRVNTLQHYPHIGAQAQSYEYEPQFIFDQSEWSHNSVTLIVENGHSMDLDTDDGEWWISFPTPEALNYFRNKFKINIKFSALDMEIDNTINKLARLRKFREELT